MLEKVKGQSSRENYFIPFILNCGFGWQDGAADGYYADGIFNLNERVTYEQEFDSGSLLLLIAIGLGVLELLPMIFRHSLLID